MVKLEFDLKKALNEIKTLKAKKVLVQIPEGLKTRGIELIEKLRNECIKLNLKTNFILIVNPLFGACDLALNEMKAFKADLIIHFGHNEFMKVKNTVYLPGNYLFNEKEIKENTKILVNELRKEKINKIGIAGPIQYNKLIKVFIKEIEKNKIKVLTSKGKRTIEGQILGCDAFSLKKIEKKVQAIVFVGDGLFHEDAVIFSLNKKIFSLNPKEKKLKKIKNEKKRFLRKRFGLIALAENAKVFGVLISTKAGQLRLGNALRLKKLIESKNKKAVLIASDLILPEYLLGLKIDCFVNTACPRLIDDSFKFEKPLINPIELEIALKTKKIEEYEFNAFF